MTIGDEIGTARRYSAGWAGVDRMNAAEIKKVAIATCDTSFACICRDCLHSRCAERGKAAILATLDAIREPSEAMIRAGDKSQTEVAGPDAGSQVAMASSVPWQAMIDALKKEVAG